MWLVLAITIARYLRGPPLQACRAGPPEAASQFDPAPTDAPARPLVVRPDQRIEADAQLVRELGLHGIPTQLGELTGNDSGIAAQGGPGSTPGGRGDGASLGCACCTPRLGPTVPAKSSRFAADRHRHPRRLEPSAVVLRYERREGERANWLHAFARPKLTQIAHAPHRSRAIPDVVSRPGSEARAGQQRLRPRRRSKSERRKSSSAASS